MQNGVKSSTAYANTLKGCRSEVRGLAKDIESGTISIGDLQSSLEKSQKATTGFSRAFAAIGNTLLTLGISVAIDKALEGVSYLIHKGEQEREKLLEKGDTSQEEINNINSLYEAYQSANKAYENNTGSKQGLITATDDLLTALGVEKDRIGELVSKYGSLDKAINQLSVDALVDAQDALTSAHAAAEDDFVEYLNGGFEQGFWSGIFSFANKDRPFIHWASDEDNKKFTDELIKQGFFDIGKNRVVAQMTESTTGGDAAGIEFEKITNIEEALEYYDTLIKMREALTAQNGKLWTENELVQSNAFKEITANIDKIQDKYDKLEETISAQNKNKADTIIKQQLVDGEELPKTLKEFETYRDKLIETAVASGEFAGSQDQIKKSINEVLYSYDQLKGFMQEPSTSKSFLLNKDFSFEDVGKAIDDFRNKIKPINLSEAIQNKSNKKSVFEDLEGAVKNALGFDEKTENLEKYAEAFGLTTDEFTKSYDKLQKQFDQEDTLSQFPEEFREAYESYKQTVDDFNALELKDPTQTVFGNVDLDNRQRLVWTEKTLNQFKSELQSVYKREIEEGYKGNWSDFANDMLGSVSTVIGGYERYGKDNIPIAFSPMLQTKDGAVLLSQETVDKYISSLVGSLDESGKKWSNEDLLKLDTKGLEIDGQRIKGLIADIGATAEKTSSAMHFLGKDGAIAEQFKYLENTGKYLDISSEKFSKFIQDTEKAEWFDKLSTYNKGIVFDISLRTDNIANWSLERLQEEMLQVDKTGKTTEEQMQSLKDILADTGDDGFVAGLQKDIAEIDKLREALKTVNGLSQEDRISLAMDMPELLPYVSDTELFKQKLNELYNTSKKGLDDRLQGQIDGLKETAPVAAEVLERIKTSMDNLYNADFSLDIDDEISSLNDLWTVMSESASATGLTSDSITKLKNRYGELADFKTDKLFEKTANGIHLNAVELRNLEREYGKQKTDDINNQLKTLINQYEDLSREIDKTTDAEKRAELTAQQNYLSDEIDRVSTLASQYEGLTSSYNKWQKAQSVTSDSQMFEDISAGFEKTQKILEGGEGSLSQVSPAVREFVQMFTTDDMLNADNSTIIEFFRELKDTSFKRYFENVDGSSLLNFLQDVKEAGDDLGKSWVTLSEDGEWAFDFGVGGDKAIAKALTDRGMPMTEEAVQSILKALSVYAGSDFKINLDSLYTNIESLKQIKTEAELANDKLMELGKTDIRFNLNTTDLTTLNKEIPQARLLLDQFRKEKGEVDLDIEGAEEAQEILEQLIIQKQQLTDSKYDIFNVDTSKIDDSQIVEAIDLMRQYHDAFNELDRNLEIGADTSNAQDALSQLALKLRDIPDSILTTLGIDVDQFHADLDEITNTKAKITADVELDDSAIGGIEGAIEGTSEKVVALVPDSKEVDEETAKENGGERTVDYKADTSGLSSVQSSTYGGTRTVYYKPDTTYLDELQARLTSNPITIPVNYGKGSAGVSGTAYANGALGGVSFRTGDWGVKKDTNALVGELGYEIMVSPDTGKWSIIGENGAEFMPVKKNSIIFNHEQSKMLLEQGRITRGKRRGKALANGTVGGDAFSRGSKGKFAGDITISSSSDSSSSGSDSSSSASNSISKANDEAKEFEETIDWIEIKLDRIERIISDLGKTSESVYRKWADRNIDLRKEISKTNVQIELEKKAYDRYLQEANSVGLDAKTAKDVREGKIDITKITDEDLSKKIKEYQQWYNKVLECQYAVTDLTESVNKLYSTAFDNVATRFDSALSAIENERNIVSEYISQTEAQGRIVNSKLYSTLADRERRNISQLEKEKIELTKAMNDAVNSGAVKRGSQEWHRMSEEIANVTLEIEKGTTQLLEYAKSIRQIRWDVFDLIQDRISNIITEADFMINLLSNKRLFDKRGQFTYEGNATMGLHTSNYDTYMKQAEEYAQAVEAENAKIYGDAYESYKEIVEEFNNLHAGSADQTIFGNIDLNNRQVIKWTKETLNQYKKELQSWYDDAADDWDSFVKDMDGSIATVIGSSSEWEGVEIAFSPMLQTDNGAVLLNANTVYKYIDNLVSQMPEGWTNDDLFKLDAQGLEVDGIQIKNLIADIGDTAIKTGEAMHYLGKDGAIALLERQLNDVAEADKEVVARRDELLKLQQESILAAENEKIAVRDLVKEGIENELASLKELIDKKKESLDVDKDAYDYAKRIKKETKNLASLEKQLASLSGDTSEENKSKLQKLKVEYEESKENLQETQMDKFISESKAIYDQLYTSYETVLNKRLDNIDKLFNDMIQAVNDSSSAIASELYNTAESVGYKTSEAFNTTWSNAYNSIKGDSDKRLEQMTQTMDNLIQEGKLKPEDKQSILDAIRTGDVTNIDNVLSLIKDKVDKGIITEETANNIRASMSATTDMKQALEALNIVSDLQKANLITGNVADQLVQSIISSNKDDIPYGLNDVLTKLISEKQISISEGSALISAINGKSADSVVGALNEADQLLKDGLITSTERDALVSGIISGNNKDANNIIARLMADNVDSANRMLNLMQAVGIASSKAEAQNIAKAVNDVQTLLENGIISDDDYKKMIGYILDGENDKLKETIDYIKQNYDISGDVEGAINNLSGQVVNAISGLSSYVDSISKSTEEVSNDIKDMNDTLEEYLKGDANQDGKVNVRDAATIANAAARGALDELPDSSDYNDDGKVNVRDAAAIARDAAKSVLPKTQTSASGNVVTPYNNGKAVDNGASSVVAVKNVNGTVDDNKLYDFDNNGVLNSKDIEQLRKIVTNANAVYNVMYDINNDKKLNVRDVAELKKKLNLAKGAKRINSNTTAWTQEEGQEVIIRPSDGAILTPLARNDSVLTASATSNIWNMANDPEKFIRENIKVNSTDIPAVKEFNNNSIDADFSITLPNVQSYEDFKYAMQHDKSFETMVRSMTVDRLFGKSSLRKYKV